jgi:hypothetical protein
MSRKTLFALVLLAALAAPAAQANPFYQTPTMNQTYYCFSPSDWQTIRFVLNPVNPAYYRGLVYIDGDNKKGNIAAPSNGSYGTTWEYTQPIEGLQCQDMLVQWGGRNLSFQSCNDGQARYCFY